MNNKEIMFQIKSHLMAWRLGNVLYGGYDLETSVKTLEDLNTLVESINMEELEGEI